ncbi:DUF6438 domain-containing protein (plasmid) [Kovacikia minuta CCNUW1]|uniref:DUF6438 domain-containing protein n=1 Tax=Kovacikia minuta TaxID=2931930 RepID=UPI001CCA72A6|nr:DUF6438 domain-containing protein [Kovacikia minuta]UBF30730.1 DUF6438 domain-containing protein [Kovacikia minuta CCNUW1]
MMLRSPIPLNLLIGLSTVLATSVLNPLLLEAKSIPSPQRVTVQPQRSSQPVMLTLERTACFGFCPIYKLTVYGNGKVVYQGRRFVKVTGTRTTTISHATVNKLISEFQRIQYFKLQNNYVGGHTDAPSAITSLAMGKQKKTVYHYLGSPDAPTQLTALENKIDAVVNSKQWIGTDAERAPEGTKK